MIVLFKGGVIEGSDGKFFRDINFFKVGMGFEKDGCVGVFSEGKVEKLMWCFENDEVEGVFVVWFLVLNFVFKFDVNCCKDEEREGFVDLILDMRKFSLFCIEIILVLCLFLVFLVVDFFFFVVFFGGVGRVLGCIKGVRKGI